MSAVLKLPLETDLDRAWLNLNAELARWERQYGIHAPGGDAPLEAAFDGLLSVIHARICIDG